MNQKNPSSLFEAITKLCQNHNQAMGYVPKAVKESAKPDLLMDMGISETSIMEDLEFLKNSNAIPRKVDDLETDIEPEWLGNIRKLGDADPANILIKALEEIKNACGWGKGIPVQILQIAVDGINDYWDAMGLNTGLKYSDGTPIRIGDRINL